MDYKKLYKEALKRAKDLTIDGYLDAVHVEEIFHELKEIKDEKIRKDIIAFIKENYSSAKSWVAWLEKQGEKPGKSIIEAWKDMRLEVYQQASGNRHEPNCSDDNTKMFSLNDIDEIIEKINEQTEKVDNQNCVKPADKVEPKFHEGDWVVMNENHNSIYQVEKIENYHYILRHILGGIFRIPFDSENSMRPWTIKYAKEGDVIFDKSDNTIGIFKCFGMLPDGGCNNDDSYCYLHCQYDPPYADITLDNEAFSEDVVPATKEQRDLLFAKMKEAGYEWDAEKKKLIKL